ncbi:MAG TPA: hypothetical protein VK694_02600 [Verrucomicrobiae bacterium]|nr:hypothetical protein [Verrucomicrobiae bacterium]
MSLNADVLTDADKQTLVELLQKLHPGFLPFEVFIEVARLVVLPIIEFVPLRTSEGRVEVLLLERDVWPFGLHTPGTVIRATDSTKRNYQAFDRIMEELGGTEVALPHYVGSNLHSSQRGVEQAQIFWVEVLGKPKAGHFYPADNLPDNLMQSQENFIELAVKDFRKHNHIK